MAFQKVGRAEEISPGETKFLCLAGKPIIVTRWAGDFYAVAGLCPHQGNPLEGARVWDYLIDCPWHHFQYDVRTGENHYPKKVYPTDYPRLQAQLRPIETYPVEVKDGEIWVNPERALPRNTACLAGAACPR